MGCGSCVPSSFFFPFRGNGFANVNLSLKAYVHDYLMKHGFPGTAAHFSVEAGLNDGGIPVNAREGVLYELVIV